MGPDETASNKLSALFEVTDVLLMEIFSPEMMKNSPLTAV